MCPRCCRDCCAVLRFDSSTEQMKQEVHYLLQGDYFKEECSLTSEFSKPHLTLYTVAKMRGKIKGK